MQETIKMRGARKNLQETFYRLEMATEFLKGEISIDAKEMMRRELQANPREEFKSLIKISKITGRPADMDMLIQAAERTEGLHSEPPPFVLQTALGDFAASYQVNAFCAEVDRMPQLYSQLHANIQDVFNEHGVQIMSPAYVADPETAKLVPREQWYAEPASKPE